MKPLPKLEGRMMPDKQTAQKRRRVSRAYRLFFMILALLVVLTGCVTQEEIDAARQQNSAGATPVPQTDVMEPLDPMGEEGGGGELGTSNTGDLEDDAPKGLLDQLVELFGSRNQSLQIIALLTVLSLAPSILIMLTSFVRIIMVLSFTRNAMGLQQMPPNQVLVGLALFLTLFVMGPVIDEVKTEAIIPYVAETIELDEAVERGVKPIRKFMVERTLETDLGMFYSFTDEPLPETDEDLYEVPLRILIPAFLTGELRRAFEIGFFIYIPFIVIDMIVASVLMAMGMMMLPPIVISLPFKVLLFVLVDGWQLTFKTLLESFGL